MSKSILLGLAAILILSVSVYAADIPQNIDPTLARTTEGLVERAEAPETDVLALFGSVVLTTDWRALGIYGNGYDGAGITIDRNTGDLYFMSQYRYGRYPDYYYRVWRCGVDASGTPFRIGWYRVPRHNPPGYYYDPPWGLGSDMDIDLWYTVADFYTPHLLEMTIGGVWTGRQYTYGEYAWYGDLGENHPSNHVFAYHVGNENNIIEFTQTGVEVDRFGHADWNYISQRALSTAMTTISSTPAAGTPT
jgi:hypothetical protein